MRGVHIETEEVKAAVSNWLRSQPIELYTKETDNLITRLNKCVAKEGDSLKSKAFFEC